MFGVRHDFRFEIALAFGVLLGLAAGTALAPTPGSRRCPYAQLRGEPPRDQAIRAHDAASTRRHADELYRERRFHAAADAIEALGSEDVDLVNLATQYRQLAIAWTIGMDPDATAADRFHALRRAWKLDTVLGGAHGETLQQRLGDIALIAAPELAELGDPAGADLARHTAEVLGR